LTWFDLTFKPENGQLSREPFVAALYHKRYQDWHFNDVFSRLDKDQSGELSFEEFTAFLIPDVRQRQMGFTPLEPQGDAKRTSTGVAMKLVGADACNTAGQASGPRLKQETANFFAEKARRNSAILGLPSAAEEFNRLDYIRQRVKCKGELYHKGKHIFSGCAGPLRDLAHEQSCGLRDFDEKAKRTHFYMV